MEKDHPYLKHTHVVPRLLEELPKEFLKIENHQETPGIDLLTMPAVTNIAAYRFAPLDDLEPLRERLIARCRGWNLRGTILLSAEGINLFVAGGRPEIDLLLAELRAVPGLEDLRPKISASAGQPFTRMLVKIKKEIIAFGVEGIDPALRPAPKLSPQDLKQWLDEGRPITLLDTRNDFEVKLGTFRNARPIGVAHFRDFPEAAGRLPVELKTQPIVLFCTGGIRCEKAGPYLQREGFKQVFQLDGGILNYFEECGGEHYEGECFVFDKRVGLEPTLEAAPRTLCFACRSPLSAEEQLDSRFVEGISCPHCHRSPAEQRAVELAERWVILRRTMSALTESLPPVTLRPLRVPGGYSGHTVLEFLLGVLGSTTAHDWRTECERGMVLDSNHRPAPAERIVAEGERYFHRRPAAHEPPVNANIGLLYEDEAIIVLDKPAPLPIHRGGRCSRNTLQAILRDAYAPQKPRPTYRLDADATGVVLFARTAAIAKFLEPQFDRGQVELICFANFQGWPSQDEFSHAGTDFRTVRRRADGTALLEARPRSGRPDSLRLHLLHLGWPVVGEGQAPRVDAAPLRLHAHRLTLAHPLRGDRLTFEAPLPSWVESFV